MGGTAMRKLPIALALVFVVAIIASVRAEEDKEVTLKGTITCAKCDLKKEKACTTVIVVKKDDKETIYYFDKDSGKKHHKEICTEAKKGEVTGTVKKDGEKMVVTVKELKFD
jgi:hypothetical protein